MSRVRDALKRADHMSRELAVRERPAQAPIPTSERAPLDPARVDLRSETDFEEPEAEQAIPRVRPSFLSRMIRRVRYRLGLRSGTPVPRCKGFTRVGLACRGPAMANGFCRMHGGSRYGKLGHAMQHLRDRMRGPAERADQFGD
jgi:hypothetical protein